MEPYSTFWLAVTGLGDPRVWASVCAILFFVRLYFKRKQGPENKKFLWATSFIILIGIGMLACVVLSEGLEYYFKIPRPCSQATNPYCPSSYSFPSTHTTTAFIVFPGIYSLIRRKKHLWVLALPFLVGFSRIELGVHTFYDVLGGAFLGIFGFSVLLFWVSELGWLNRLSHKVI